MHKVKRAIIMAAGVGKRMKPVTDELPKPLIKVNGIRMIDTIIEGLYKNGIYEIHIVVGYLKEAFMFLNKYPDIHFIENSFYDSCNNISSLYVARDYIEDTIILDGDQIIYNSDVLKPEFEKSGYNCVWTDKNTKEWLLTVKNESVIGCSREGGANGWQLYSISRWAKEDGKKLKHFVEIEFAEKNNRDIYWDDIALFCYPNDFDLGIREMKNGDVAEIDTIKELAYVDKTYMKYLIKGD